MDATKKAKALVDLIFDEGFETYSKMKAAEIELTRLLDMCGKPHGKKKKIKEVGRPYDNPLINKMGTADSGSREAKAANSEIGDAPDTGPDENDTDYQSKEENPQKLSNDINHVPNQKVGALLKSVHDELEEMLNHLKESREAYQKYFKSMMAKHGIKSIKDLSPEKKKEFFNAVDKSWKAKSESVVVEKETPEQRLARNKKELAADMRADVVHWRAKCAKSKDPKACMQKAQAKIAKHYASTKKRFNI